MKKIDKYVVTSIVFLGIIIYAGLYIFINNLGEIKSIILADLDIKEKIQAIEYAYREIPNEDKVLDIYSIEQKLIQSSFFEDTMFEMIIKDIHGKLHFQCIKLDVTGCVAEIKKLNEELNKIDVPLIYMQYPNKKLEGYTKFPISEYENWSNENADDFLNLIKDSGIKYLDLRDKIIEQDLDRNSLFYKTDHHWTNKGAFWATSEIVRYLNDNFGFNIDESIVDSNNYNFKEYKKCFLGSLGRRIGRYVTGLDDYTLIYPKFDTDYEVYYPKENKTEPLWVGNFGEAIVKKERLENKDVQTDRYTAYFGEDYGNLIIRNKKVTDGKKILLIKDSYSLPVAAFLSTGLEELHLVDVRYEDAPNDLVKYIKNNDFDAVMVNYTTHVFTNELFDFGV